MTQTPPAGRDTGVLGPADAGEILTLQRAAYVTEALAHDDLSLPPLHQTVAEVREELDLVHFVKTLNTTSAAPAH